MTDEHYQEQMAHEQVKHINEYLGLPNGIFGDDGFNVGTYHIYTGDGDFKLQKVRKGGGADTIVCSKDAYDFNDKLLIFKRGMESVLENR